MKLLQTTILWSHWWHSSHKNKEIKKTCNAKQILPYSAFMKIIVKASVTKIWLEFKSQSCKGIMFTSKVHKENNSNYFKWSQMQKNIIDHEGEVIIFNVQRDEDDELRVEMKDNQDITLLMIQCSHWDYKKKQINFI